MSARRPAPAVSAPGVAAVAATEPDGGRVGDSLLAAALLLPGLASSPAIAQSAPDKGVVSIRYLDYRDRQGGADRMHVTSPAFYVLAPIGERWSVEASTVFDSMTGASPLFHNSLSGASGVGVHDYRKAADFKLTRYFERVTVGASIAVSSEHDYLSRAAAVDIRFASEDRNRTFAFGIGGSSDRITSENLIAENETRHTVDALIGLTQILSANTVIQSNLTWSQGHGYYSDPYKPFDRRPDHRRQLAWLTRLNHFVPPLDAAVRASYRFAHDSFGSSSHTLEVAWHQNLPQGWSVTPLLRYYTQSAADFYFDPPFPAGFVRGRPYSADTRLAAFGAITAGVRIAKQLPGGVTLDLKFDAYRQRAGWRLGGGGSPGIEPLSARWIQVGVSKNFD